jgi:hypothetical protein
MKNVVVLVGIFIAVFNFVACTPQVPFTNTDSTPAVLTPAPSKDLGSECSDGNCTEESPVPQPCPAGVTLPEGILAESCGSVPADAYEYKYINPDGLNPVTDGGNIQCAFEDAVFYCQVYDYSFVPEEMEDGQPAPAVSLEQDTRLATSSDEGEQGRVTLNPDQAFYQGDKACRPGENDITCWNTQTGHGFHLSRIDLTRW